MIDYNVKILEVANLTHDVRRFTVEKPAGYYFVPGQATEVAIKKPGWETEKRPFTFTSSNDLSHLEFVIKNYHDHNGMTHEMSFLKAGDELIIGDAWGAIEYKGPGYFIAGGAGITPFIAIMRKLKKENLINGNKLFFSNKTSRDIISEKELASLFGNGNVIFTLTDEKNENYDYRFINEDFIKKEVSDFGKRFYVCGPEKMVSDINTILSRYGVSPDNIVFER